MRTKNSIARVCATCSETFYVRPSRVKFRATLYCSRGCCYQAQRRTVANRCCLGCGQSFRPRMSASSVARGEGKFCTQTCSNRFHRGSISDRLWAPVLKTETCWLRPLTKNHRYSKVLWKGRHRLAHTVAWELVMGPIPPGKQINHVCDVTNCIRNDDVGLYMLNGVEYPRCGHLWLGTSGDNIRDAKAKGRIGVGETHWTRYRPGEMPAGADHGRAKLSADIVLEYRAKFHNGELESFEVLGKKLGVNPSTISRAVQGKSWKQMGRGKP